jgi:hypothetical protein
MEWSIISSITFGGMAGIVLSQAMIRAHKFNRRKIYALVVDYRLDGRWIQETIEVQNWDRCDVDPIATIAILRHLVEYAKKHKSEHPEEAYSNYRIKEWNSRFGYAFRDADFTSTLKNGHE